MISKLTNQVTRNLLEKNVILNEEKDLYEYGLFMIFSNLVFFIFSTILGFVMKIPIEGIIFYITFSLIRNYSGGVHANSETTCTILTTLSIIISEAIIKLFAIYDIHLWAIILIVFSSICFIGIKPVANSKKRISEYEKKSFHKKTILIICFIIIISSIFLYFNCYNVICAISIGMTLSVILFLIGKLYQIKLNLL